MTNAIKYRANSLTIPRPSILHREPRATVALMPRIRGVLLRLTLHSSLPGMAGFIKIVLQASCFTKNKTKKRSPSSLTLKSGLEKSETSCNAVMYDKQLYWTLRSVLLSQCFKSRMKVNRLSSRETLGNLRRHRSWDVNPVPTCTSMSWILILTLKDHLRTGCIFCWNED